MVSLRFSNRHLCAMMVVQLSTINQKRRETMMNITTVGLDLAKNCFHVVCFNHKFNEVKKKMLRRHQVIGFFNQLDPCRIGMEACSGSSFWGRELRNLGHEIVVIPPKHVKPFVRGNKNDYNDARAIAEAANRSNIPKANIKTVAQQDIQALHRMRTQCLRDRTALCNSTRGFLHEYGIIMPKGISNLRKRIPELLQDTEGCLTATMRHLLARRYKQLVELDGHITFYTEEMLKLSQQDDSCKRLQTIPGYGPIVASAFLSVIGNGCYYRRGRDVSASLGLVPRQHSSGGKNVLLGISKRGDAYLRSLLVHGARAVVAQAARKQDPLSRWINRIHQQRGRNKAIVAMANKMARMGWAVLHYGTRYQPGTAVTEC